MMARSPESQLLACMKTSRVPMPRMVFMTLPMAVLWYMPPKAVTSGVGQMLNRMCMPTRRQATGCMYFKLFGVPNMS